MNYSIKSRILKYETLKCELEEVEVLSKQYFEQFVNEIFPNQFNNIDDNHIVNNSINIDDEVIITENLKKIYKKLCLSVHPDRNINTNFTDEEREENEEIFKEILQSYQSGDLCNLLVRARQFRIKIPELLDQDIEILDKNIKKFADKLDRIKKQMSWIWCTTNDPRVKERIKKQCKEMIEKSILFDWIIEERTICAICLDDMTEGKSEKRIICGHIFHNHCIMTWFSIKFQCPLCRRSFE